MGENTPLQPTKQGFRAKVWTVLNERLGLDSLSYHVPEYANSLPYVLGGMTMFSFIVLVFSGLYLAQFYNPNPVYAHQSVMYIITNVPFGDFVRSIHFWSSNIAMMLIVIHGTRVFITASYKRPREVTWFSGIGLLALTIGFIFTGTVLKWDQEGLEALAHNEAIAGFLGKLGTFLTPGFTNSVPLFTRLYNTHTTVLLLCFIAILFAHLFLIKRHGISQKAVYGEVSKATSGMGTSHFYMHLKKLFGYGFLILAATAILALFFPAPLGQPGVPGMELTKPPWMFLPFYAMENIFGLEALLWSPAILFALLLLVPFVDRSKWVSPKQRKFVIAAGAIVFATLIALTLFSAFAPIKNHLGGEEGMSKPVRVFSFRLPQLAPVAYAHGMTILQATPTVVEAGGKLLIKADGLEAGMTYALYLEGIQSSLTLGTVTVEKDEDSFDVEFLLPETQKPDIFQVKAVDSSGNVMYAGDSIAVVHTTPDFNDKATHPEISRAKSPGELAVIETGIVICLSLGLILIHEKKQKEI